VRPAWRSWWAMRPLMLPTNGATAAARLNWEIYYR
jgi:hypothetical protein